MVTTTVLPLLGVRTHQHHSSTAAAASIMSDAKKYSVLFRVVDCSYVGRAGCVAGGDWEMIGTTSDNNNKYSY